MYNFNKSTRKYIFFFIHYLILDIVDVMALEKTRYKNQIIQIHVVIAALPCLFVHRFPNKHLTSKVVTFHLLL